MKMNRIPIWRWSGEGWSKMLRLRDAPRLISELNFCHICSCSKYLFYLFKNIWTCSKICLFEISSGHYLTCTWSNDYLAFSEFQMIPPPPESVPAWSRKYLNALESRSDHEGRRGELEWSKVANTVQKQNAPEFWRSVSKPQV